MGIFDGKGFIMTTGRIIVLTTLIGMLCTVQIQAALNDGLVGYWNFEEGSGTTVHDLSGNGHDATFTGSPQWVSGKGQYALQFDGNDDYIEIPNTSSLNLQSAFTLSAWVKYTANESNYEHAIFSKHNCGTGNGFALETYLGKPMFFLVGSRVVPTSSYNDGEWHYIVGTYTYDNATASLYIDGDFICSGIISYNSTNSVNWRIAASTPNGYYPCLFNGTIDEVRIYDRALSASEVAALDNVSQVTVSGTVTLEDYIGDNTSVPVTFTIRNPGSTTVLETHTVYLGSDGSYSFNTTLVGTYDIAAKAFHWLRQKQANIDTTSNATVDFSLINGDINGDNTIGIEDYSTFTTQYDTAGPEADLNGDGWVTIEDYSILTTNYGLDGDD
jgi:hypothetical protein